MNGGASTPPQAAGAYGRMLGLGMALVMVANAKLLSADASVKWDGIDEMWTYLRFMGSALRQGVFPDFFPHIVSGYPLGANMQAGVYNAAYLAAAAAFPTTVWSVNLIFLTTHVALFAVVFALGRTWRLGPEACLAFGLSTVGGGFLVGNATHLSYAATTLGLLMMLLGLRWAATGSNRNWPFIAVTVLGAHHTLTAGYPALTAFGAQCLLVALVWAAFEARTQAPARRALLGWMGAALLGLALGLPAVLHLWHQSQNWHRAGGVSLSALAAGSLPPTSLLNLLAPGIATDTVALWASLSNPERVVPDRTMLRFHLLHLSVPALVLCVWACRSDTALRRRVWACATVAAVATALALGEHMVPPIRLWLAEWLFPYRLGRFPAGEHRGVALLALGLAAAAGVGLMVARWPRQRRWIVAALALDFLVVMSLTKGMRHGGLSGDLQRPAAAFQTVFGPQDQALIDQPRLCPDDGEDWARTAILTQWNELAPAAFYWRGYTNLVSTRYEDEHVSVRGLICGPSRLWTWPQAQPQAYRLERYEPGRVVFTLGETTEHGRSHGAAEPHGPGPQVHDRVATPILHRFVWADHQDGLWTLKVNGQASKFEDGPAALRYFSAPPGARIEMIYAGPLTRILRLY